MRKLLLFSALLVVVLVFAASPALASTHPSCQWVQVDTDNDPSTPPVSVYGYWADLSGTQVLIVCDPKTGEPVQDQDGNGIAYVNNGEYIQAEKQVLDKYETKQALDWEHPKEVRPFQVSVFAPNVPLTLTYNLQDINAHGGLWVDSTGNCLTWGYSDGRARLLSSNPDDWLIVMSVMNPNPFSVSGDVCGSVDGWLSYIPGWRSTIGKSLNITLGPNETKYVLLNRGMPAPSWCAPVLAREASGLWYGSIINGYSLAELHADNVTAENADDFPGLLKPAKGFYLADPNSSWATDVWPMRFGTWLDCATRYNPNWFSFGRWRGTVQMDEEGKFHAKTDRPLSRWISVDNGFYFYDLQYLSEQETERRVEDARVKVEAWFNSHKITDIPLVWYGAPPVAKDGIRFDYCRPAAYWWPDTRGAVANWWEQTAPPLVGPRWETYYWASYWPRPQHWKPDSEQNWELYSFYGHDYQVGSCTLWSGGTIPQWLPVVKARLCFVHRYSWIPVNVDLLPTAEAGGFPSSG